MNEVKDINTVSVIVPGPVWQRLVSWLAAQPYQNVFQPMKDLEENIWEADNDVLEKIKNKEPIISGNLAEGATTGVHGAEEAQEIDRQVLEQLDKEKEETDNHVEETETEDHAELLEEKKE